MSKFNKVSVEFDYDLERLRSLCEKNNQIGDMIDLPVNIYLNIIFPNNFFMSETKYRIGTSISGKINSRKKVILSVDLITYFSHMFQKNMTVCSFDSYVQGKWNGEPEYTFKDGILNVSNFFTGENESHTIINTDFKPFFCALMSDIQVLQKSINEN